MKKRTIRKQFSIMSVISGVNLADKLHSNLPCIYHHDLFNELLSKLQNNQHIKLCNIIWDDMWNELFERINL